MAGGTVDPEELLRAGRLEEARAALQSRIRGEPASPELRVFYFQLLCVLGDWDRAQAQLKVLSELDAGSLALAQVYGAAIACEALRREVFAATRAPRLLGEPLPWIAPIVQALALETNGRHDEAATLRASALEAAPSIPGAIDGESFAWLADADSRLGPICEAIIGDRYYWIPFERMTSVAIEKPTDLRDCVWMPAHLTLTNGGDVAALLPTRYPGSESDPDPLVALARKTTWQEVATDAFHGHGQRVLATDAAEHAIMGVRRIDLAPGT
jgi:type VI secretion system protein ImpE